MLKHGQSLRKSFCGVYFFVMKIITVIVEAIFCHRSILADSHSEGHSNPRR
jgi:hypothetical protein